MVNRRSRRRAFHTISIVSVLAILASACTGGGGSSPTPATTTPIQHLIVVIGENRSFDNVFATYVPPDPSQQVWNLLSLGIVNTDGSPGPKVSLASQNQATDTTTYQIAPTQSGAFSQMVQPSTTLGALPASPCFLSNFLLDFTSDNPAGILFCTDLGLEPSAEELLNMGGTEQLFYSPSEGVYPVPDCRYPSNLTNAPFSIVGASQLNSCPGPTFPTYKSAITPTAYTDNFGDPAHRFFQMWQQNDCDMAHKSATNPSGCAHDLYLWVATTVGWQITRNFTPPTPGDDQATFQGGVSMGFYNMQEGDYPYFRFLADTYALNDNYHQFVMGGTGPNSQSIGTGDVYYYTDSSGNPARPAANLIENPDPQPGTNNFYTNASPGNRTGGARGNFRGPSSMDDLGSTSTGGLVNCSDPTQPGVASIFNYLGTLGYSPFQGGNCSKGHFYQLDNEYPSYDHLGNPNTGGNEFPGGPGFAIGPQTIPTIGDALSAKNISWKYYGEGFNRASDPDLANELYCVICNPFQFAKSIMTTSLKNNLVDLDVFFKDVSAGTLPAVSFVKPDVLLDSHPGSSTPPLFEGFAERIIDTVQANPEVWKDTAILVTFDESGGNYDSGYIQPIDFFGDGPRTVMIAVSPFSRFGSVDHTYSDHASILKFIEKNWRLAPLSARSRDNLPNPSSLPAAPYFPTNSPAIGDLMNMFNFGG